MKVKDPSTLSNWTLRISATDSITTHRARILKIGFIDESRYGSEITNGIITHIVKYIKR